MAKFIILTYAATDLAVVVNADHIVLIKEVVEGPSRNGKVVTYTEVTLTDGAIRVSDRANEIMNMAAK